jgi:IS30 family transposase
VGFAHLYQSSPDGDISTISEAKTETAAEKGTESEARRIPNRIGIEHRPKVADLKTEIGHWESDTVIGKNHTGIVVTHVDKASKYLLAGLANNKTMEEINRVTLKLFEPVKPEFRKTIVKYPSLIKKIGIQNVVFNIIFVKNFGTSGFMGISTTDSSQKPL